jgi:hypothetical protein
MAVEPRVNLNGNVYRLFSMRRTDSVSMPYVSHDVIDNRRARVRFYCVALTGLAACIVVGQGPKKQGPPA